MDDRLFDLYYFLQNHKDLMDKGIIIPQNMNAMSSATVFLDPKNSRKLKKFEDLANTFQTLNQLSPKQ